MSLKHSYSILAPVYDAIVGAPSAAMRQASLNRLGDTRGKHVLLAGIGTGLDIPHLPGGATYIGMDLTPAMLQRARQRSRPRDDILLHRADVMNMPYAAARFDIVVMHLILAVVPFPERALAEAARVVKPGGRILILDKFLHRGQLALIRRSLNLLLRHIATRTDVVLENLLDSCPQLTVSTIKPLRPGNWFHEVELTRPA